MRKVIRSLGLIAIAGVLTGCVATSRTATDLDPRLQVPESFFAYQSATAESTMGLVSQANRPIYRYLAKRIGKFEYLYRDPRSGKFGEGSCTATLIYQNMILTARHCLGNLDAISVTKAVFVPNLTDLKNTSFRAYDVLLPPVEVSDKKLDFAILKLKTKEVLFNDVLPVRKPVVGEDVFVLGHPGGKRLHYSEESCVIPDIKTNDNHLVPHTCATENGHSGAFIFAKSDFAILGMHSRGHVPAHRIEVNRAVKIGEMVNASRTLQSLYGGYEASRTNVTFAPVTDAGSGSFDAAVTFKFAENTWIDGLPPVREARETALKYCADTIGDCGSHGSFTEVAPLNHDPYHVGVAVCGEDGNYYQLRIQNREDFEYTKKPFHWSEIGTFLTHQTGTFAQSLSRFNRTQYGDILLAALNADCNPKDQ